MVTLSHLDKKFKKIKYLEIIKTLETNLQFEMSLAAARKKKDEHKSSAPRLIF